MYVSAVISAGGAGRRMGGDIPKQFIDVAGKPLLLHTLQKFEDHKSIDEIVVVSPYEYIDTTGEMIKKQGIKKVSKIVPGGAERMDSVAAGLNAVSDNADIILIHDGVRPLVAESDIEAVIEKANETGAAILALPVRDTIKRVEQGAIVNTLNRSILWRAQTPQAFRAEIIKNAYKEAISKGFKATDDAQVVEMTGICVSVIKGAGPNLKVTDKNDLSIVSLLLSGEKL